MAEVPPCGDTAEAQQIATAPIGERITPLDRQPIAPWENAAAEDDAQLIQTKPEADAGSAVQHPPEPQAGKADEFIPSPDASDQAAGSFAFIEGGLASLRGGGRALPKTLRDELEPRFGYDFSSVHIHTGQAAANLSWCLNARAFTVGKNIVFGAGRYSFATSEGRRLIAHELTHVVQQTARVSGRPSGNIHRTKKSAAHCPLTLGASRAYPLVQRQSLIGEDICKKFPRIQIPRLFTTGFQYHRGGAGSWGHSLGPFTCNSPRYPIKEGNRLLGNTRAIAGYRKQLQIQASSDKKIIEWIHNIYLKTVSGSTHYTDYITKLHKFAGVTPSKSGGQPKAGVAAEARAFLSDVLREWHLLGKFSPPSGSNPFDNWATRLHEEHHQKTILNYPEIKQGAAKIKPVKKALLTDPQLTRYHAAIRTTALDQIPLHVAQMYAALHDKRIALRDQIRKMRSRGVPYQAFSHLASQHNRYFAEERAYQKHKLNLEKELHPRYTRYKKWMEKARNFALEDLKAYCLSWKAMQQAVKFIDRCLTSARGTGLGKPGP